MTAAQSGRISGAAGARQGGRAAAVRAGGASFRGGGGGASFRGGGGASFRAAGGGGFRGGGGGGRGGGGRRSDIALKHDIVLLGRLDNGSGLLPLRLQWQRESLCRGDGAGSPNRTTGCGHCRPRRLSAGVIRAAWTAFQVLRRLGRIRECAAEAGRTCALKPAQAGELFDARCCPTWVHRISVSRSFIIDLLCSLNVLFIKPLPSGCFSF